MKTYLEKNIERRAERTRAYRQEYKNEAKRLAGLLRGKGFEFKKIYLFGSVVRDRPICPWSDIDLAVEGLSDGLFYRAYACLLKNARFNIDLKPFEELDEIFRKKIKEEGIEL